MEDYMSFKQALRGFDRDEVLEYIRKQEEDFNARTRTGSWSRTNR